MIEKYTLKNGIPVFIVEMHASPVVSIQAWVARGSIHEPGKLAGISHFLEHAVFKGTKRRGVGEIAAEVESLGGEINAFTSFEETAFYATLASRYQHEGIDIIADLVQGPIFDKEEILKEREVILEEIRRAHDSPGKMVSMNLWQNSFPGTPYGRPVLGFTETVSKINHQSLKKYFDDNYHAGTMSVFVVGDVNPKETLEIVEKKFGKAKRKADKKVNFSVKKPSGKNVPVISIARDVNECQIQIGFQLPSINDPLIPFVDLMTTAVGHGESSRLYQRMVKETKLAQEAHFGLVASSHCGLATITLVTTSESLEPAVKESFRLLREVAETGIHKSELERVKTSLEADVVAGKETVEGYARRLGYYYTEFGDPDYEGKYLQSLLSVDRERATRALKGILKQRPVVSLVHPKDKKIDKKAFGELLSVAKFTEDTHTTVRNLPQIEESQGLRFITKVEDSLPCVAVKILFLGGSREETEDKQGVGGLFGRLWTSGTKSHTALSIAHTLESIGASIHGFSGKNTCGISVECLTKHWEQVKSLLGEVLLTPTFPVHEFETERGLVLQEILSEKDSPGQMCQINFLSSIYGRHPYGRKPMGTKETIQGITVADLQTYYKSFVTRENAVISCVGDFEQKKIVSELTELLTQLPKSGKKPTALPAIPESPKVNVVWEKKEPLFQSHLLVGFLGASFRDNERYALKLLSSCLAGQGGRLFLELRDKQSLAYQVAPLNSDSPERGIFGFYIGCATEKLERSLGGIRTEIEKILQGPMDKKELDRAKEYWIGRFDLDMQRFGAQAMLFGLDELYGLGFDHYQKVPDIIKSVTSEDILNAARKFLKPAEATISIVHNAAVDTDKILRVWEGTTSSPKLREKGPMETSEPRQKRMVVAGNR